MKVHYQIPALLGTAALVITLPQAAIALESSHVNAIAKEITVLINGQNSGSGVIIAKAGNTYTVLTAAHVVATPDEYEVVTPDRNTYILRYSTVKKMSGVDLAVLEFTSDRSYAVAKLGNSDEAIEGKRVHIAGFPNPGREIPRIYQFTTAEISSLPNPPLRDGYALIYTNITRMGMSGGPILNEEGLVIGIHGQAEGERMTGEQIPEGKVGFNLGIPVNTFLHFASQIGLNLNLPTASNSDSNSPSLQTKTAQCDRLIDITNEVFAAMPLPNATQTENVIQEFLRSADFIDESVNQLGNLSLSDNTLNGYRQELITLYQRQSLITRYLMNEEQNQRAIEAGGTMILAQTGNLLTVIQNEVNLVERLNLYCDRTPS